MSLLKDSTCLVITGRAGAGKDTFAKFVNEYPFGTDVRRWMTPLRFSQPLKRAVCSIFGWDESSINDLNYKEEPLEEPHPRRIDGSILLTRREVLQYVGSEVFRSMDPDIWVKAALRDAEEKAEQGKRMFVCTDCRFLNEQAGLTKAFGKTLFIRLFRTGERQDDWHVSECIDLLHFDMAFRFEHGDLKRMREVAALISDDLF